MSHTVPRCSGHLIPIVLLLVILGKIPAWGAENYQLVVRQELTQLLEIQALEIAGERIYMQAALKGIYAASAYEPLWSSQLKVNELITLLRDASSYGLTPADYHLELIEQFNGTRDPGSSAALMAEMDILLSDSLLLYIDHRSNGKVKAFNNGVTSNKQTVQTHDYAGNEIIQAAINAKDLTVFVNSVVPTVDYYDFLREQLNRYQQLAARGGWMPVPPGPTIRRGDEDPRVEVLRERLMMTGQLVKTGETNSLIFDAELESAVKRFQDLHGLEVDGLVGKDTLGALNVPVEARVDQLRLSLERLRWVAQEDVDTFLAVNIAGFRLSVVKDRVIVWTTRVMAGTVYRQTPVFRSNMTYLEFNPTWTVPPTILKEDTLPAVQQNPAYLTDKNISVIDPSGKRVDPLSIDWKQFHNSVPFTLRQEPGPLNALGRVKFIFPNPYSVYLHDTPHQTLFGRSQRAFSSGCVRVEDALELAQWVLQNDGQASLVDVQAILDSGQTRRVLLKKPLPVLILYLTAALDESGEVRFYRDIYQRDAAVLSALNGPVENVEPPHP